jgi:hypothetical protein
LLQGVWAREGERGMKEEREENKIFIIDKWTLFNKFEGDNVFLKPQ